MVIALIICLCRECHLDQVRRAETNQITPVFRSDQVSITAKLKITNINDYVAKVAAFDFQVTFSWLNRERETSNKVSSNIDEANKFL